MLLFINKSCRKSFFIRSIQPRSKWNNASSLIDLTLQRLSSRRPSQSDSFGVAAPHRVLHKVFTQSFIVVIMFSDFTGGMYSSETCCMLHKLISLVAASVNLSPMIIPLAQSLRLITFNIFLTSSAPTNLVLLRGSIARTNTFSSEITSEVIKSIPSDHFSLFLHLRFLTAIKNSALSFMFGSFLLISTNFSRHLPIRTIWRKRKAQANAICAF